MTDPRHLTPLEVPDDELAAASEVYLAHFADDRSDAFARLLARAHLAWRVDHPLAPATGQAPPDAAAPPPLLPGAAAPVACCGCGHVNESWWHRAGWCESCNAWYGGPSGATDNVAGSTENGPASRKRSGPEPRGVIS